ncbi:MULTISPECIES: hypothetical protein [Nocardioides]|uniref:DUF222 domain-containing protein n=1 Tax=Nocardioides vastitatis TaxID=2568655 RepID=A0ABW0ZIJ3_9ACTN|nr:hypothetical protein [Nocardioides sp.]THJ06195.1 hypothetical protein E7Z54_06140 [Nocardioides sp.]
MTTEHVDAIHDAMGDPGYTAHKHGHASRLTTLSRFGCCTAAEAEDVVARLLRHGAVVTPAGHTVRVVAFGNAHGSLSNGPCHAVTLDHVIGYLQDHPRAL